MERGIEVVARDHAEMRRQPQSGFGEFAAGSTEYARAAALGAPKAVQVADRWHVLANVRDMLERWSARAHARLRRLPPPPGDDGQPPRPAHPRRRPGRTATAVAADSRAR